LRCQTNKKKIWNWDLENLFRLPKAFRSEISPGVAPTEQREFINMLWLPTCRSYGAKKIQPISLYFFHKKEAMPLTFYAASLKM